MEKTGLKLIDESDVQLVALACGGNQGAFLVLYDRYKKGLTLYVGGFVALREDIEDIVLETFQKAFLQISTYNPSYRFSTWIYRIARNCAYDHLQRLGAVPEHQSLDDDRASLDRVAGEETDPETAVIKGQEWEKMVEAIEGLSPTYREVARMVLLENFGYQEAADALGLPLNTVKTKVKRARELVSRIMNDSNENEDD